MRAVIFFAGPLDGLLIDSVAMEPIKFAKAWAESIADKAGVIWPFSQNISSWNSNGIWSMASNDTGDIVLAESPLGQHEYLWCQVHREYEFEGAPARHV
jgi:hypothetical protein